MKRNLLLLRLVCSFFIAAICIFPCSSRAETITIVADKWCPYNCEPTDKYPGFMIELAKVAFAKHGIEVEYVVLPWSQAIEETRIGKYTAIVGASNLDAPDFVFPNVSQGWMRNVFYIKKDDSWRYSNIDSLKSISLGVVEDYSYNKVLNEYIAENRENKSRIQAVSGENALEINMGKLQSGKIRVLVEAEYVMNYYLSRHQVLQRLDIAGKLQESEQDNLYIAFGPSVPGADKYAKILSSETKALRASGRLQKILQRYGLKDWEAK